MTVAGADARRRGCARRADRHDAAAGRRGLAQPAERHAEMAAVAEALLREIPGMEVERVEPEPRIVSLIGRLSGAGPGRRLIFNGHLDTFPLLEALPWTVPPLGGVLKDGKLYGRGVCDMKGGMACSLLAAALLARPSRRLGGRGRADPGRRRGEHGLARHRLHDEARAARAGRRQHLRRRRLAQGRALRREGPDVGRDRGDRRAGPRRPCPSRHQRHRPAAHRARPAEGPRGGARSRRRPSSARRSPRAKPISEPLSGAGEAETLQRVTVNIGTIEGGTSPNLVPTHAIARADIRLPVGITTDILVARLDEWLAPLEGVSWRAIRRFEPSFTPTRPRDRRSAPRRSRPRCWARRRR